MGSLIRPADEWIELQRRKRERDRIADEERGLARQLTAERLRFADLKKQLDQIEYDKRRLEGLSLPGLFHAVLGTRREQIDLHRQKLLATRLAFDVCRDSIVRLDERRAKLQEKLDTFADLDPRLESMMHAKAKGMLNRDDPVSRDILKKTAQYGEVQGHADLLTQLCEMAAHLRGQLDELKSRLHMISRRVPPGEGDAGHPLIKPLRPLAHATAEQMNHFTWRLADAEQRMELDFGSEPLVSFGDALFGSMIDDFITGRANRQATQTIAQVRHRVTVVADILEIHRERLTTTAKQMEKALREAIEDA